MAEKTKPDLSKTGAPRRPTVLPPSIKKETVEDTTSPPKKHQIKFLKNKRLLWWLLLLSLLVAGIVSIFYYQPWQYITTQQRLQDDNEYNKLEAQLNALEKKIEQSLNIQQENAQSAVDSSVKQEQQIIGILRELNNFQTLINRWKNRLSSPDVLIANVYNHLNLVNSQMLLNYSPQLLAAQLDEVDQLIGELDIAELSSLRLEIQHLVKQLDLKENQPIDSWLREITFAEKLIPLWIQQEKSNHLEAGKNSINNSVQISNQPNFYEPPPNTSTGLLHYLVNSLQGVLKIRKTDGLPETITPSVFNETQIANHFNTRLELLRLSILSRNWDALRQQSTEMIEWLEERLTLAAERLNPLLANMSQYKPKKINVSLSKALKLMDDYYQHSQQETSIVEAMPSTTALTSPPSTTEKTIINSTP